MTSPNDIIAPFYEAANQFLKNEQVLQEELQLVKSLLAKPDARILDIGCGTGRHLIPLAEAGYNATGLDNSTGMLNILKAKATDISVVNQDFFAAKLPAASFDLIIMFWNTFNEIALTDTQASELLIRCKSLLNKNGKLLINIDDATKISPAELDFGFDITTPTAFKYFWQVKYFDAETNTTVSDESVSYAGKEYKTEITQRWWSLEELVRISEAAQLSLTVKHITCNSELYLVLEKNAE